MLGTRSLDNGQQAIQKLKDEQQQGGDGAVDNVKAVELDVTKHASISAAAAHVKSEYGRLDVLMCNAGVSGGSRGECGDRVCCQHRRRARHH